MMIPGVLELGYFHSEMRVPEISSIAFALPQRLLDLIFNASLGSA